jgi:hypothetical protein
MKHCDNPNCSLHNMLVLDKYDYCVKCGNELQDPIICICGEELMPEAFFCPKCGLGIEQIEKESAEQRALDALENLSHKPE